jgi:Fur family transcriptional regulator, peroxide stress response regulator
MKMPKLEKQPRKTKQLEVVWQAIKDDTSHPTADQVYARVRERFPNVSLGTVYRNLQKLVADEKLQVLMIGRAQHFDPLVKRHQHFICEKCGRVFDVLVDTRDEIRPAKLPHAGFKVTSHQLAFYGACKHCSR